jgi:aconitate hydratase 2/2-methylisocitrate dehydratase
VLLYEVKTGGRIPLTIGRSLTERVREALGLGPPTSSASTAVSTSSRNFPNRLVQGADVFLSSAELAAVAAVMGKLLTVEEYMGYAAKIDSMAPEIYTYLNFDKMDEYVVSAQRGQEIAVKLIA